ncbi:hypothetical protein TNCV_2287401 [Trichonephila clavipes]|nr:hypothetical protein TNCV_2287401 [Trichonephila clavipes]
MSQSSCWHGGENEVPAQVSSSTLEHGSKVAFPLQIALILFSGVSHIQAILERLKCPHIGVIWKLGEEVPTQVSSLLLDHGVEAYYFHRQYPWCRSIVQR